VTVQYKVRVQFYAPSGFAPTCAGAPSDPPQTGYRYGIVYVAGQCYADTAEVFLTAGPITLNAFPYPGWVWAGWIINGNAPNPYLSSYNLTGPAQLIPSFLPGKRVHFETNPPGLRVLVDRTSIQTSLAYYDPGSMPRSNFDTSCAPDLNRLPP